MPVTGAFSSLFPLPPGSLPCRRRTRPIRAWLPFLLPGLEHWSSVTRKFQSGRDQRQGARGDRHGPSCQPQCFPPPRQVLQATGPGQGHQAKCPVVSRSLCRLPARPTFSLTISVIRRARGGARAGLAGLSGLPQQEARLHGLQHAVALSNMKGRARPCLAAGRGLLPAGWAREGVQNCEKSPLGASGGLWPPAAPRGLGGCLSLSRSHVAGGGQGLAAERPGSSHRVRGAGGVPRTTPGAQW